MKDLAIVIPCRNESKNITYILKKLEKNRIFLVNDASTDKIKAIVKPFKNIKILNNSKKRGYERSVLRGISYIEKIRDSKLNYVLTMDADGDHNPLYVDKIYKKIKKYKVDLIIGNRSKKNRKSEEYISDIFKKKFKFEDPFSGFKIYDKKKLFNTYKQCSKNYFLADLCLIFKKKKFKIKNINIASKKNILRKSRVDSKTVDKKILSIKNLINFFL
tara:strand:+ start:546 stop:1196 length:651 start_codon:yes stop_codon:yes gene_type:complete